MLDLVVDLKGDAEQQLGGVAGALGKLGLAGIGIGQIKDVVGGAIGAFGDLATAGADEKLGFDRLVNTVKNAIPTFDGNTAALNNAITAGEAKAYQDDQVRDSLGLLVGKYKDVSKAQEVQALAMDLARAKGLSLDEATKLLLGTASKQATQLAKLGITIDKSADETTRFGDIQKAVAGQADLFANSAAGSAERTAESFQNAKEDIGQAILPLQQAILGGFATFLQSGAFQGIIESVSGILSTVVPQAIQLVSDAVSTAITIWQGLQPVIQPIVDFIGANLQPILIGLAAALLTVVVPAFIAWATAAGAAAIATVTALLPVIAPIAAIGAAVGLLMLAWNNNFGGIQTTVTTFWEGTLKPIVDQIVGFFTANIPTALAALQTIWATVWGAIQAAVLPILAAVFGELARFWVEIEPKLTAVWQNIQGIIATVWGVIQGIITAAIPIIQNTIGAGLTFIQNLWNAVWPGIQLVLSGVWDVIQGVVKVAWGIVSGIISAGLSLLQGDWSGAWTAIQNALGTVWDGIKLIISGAWDIIKGLFNVVLGELKTIWDTAWGAIKQTVTDIWTSITKWISDQIDSVKTTISTTIAIIQTAWNTFWDSVGTKVKETWDALVLAVATQIAAVQSKINEISSAIGTAWATFWDGIGTTLATAWATIVTTVTNKIGEIQTFLTSFPGKILAAVLGIGSSIVSGIQQGVANAWAGFMSFIHDQLMQLPEVVRNFLGIHSPSQVMADQVGAPIVAGIGVGMQQGWQAVLDGARQLSTSLIVLFANEFLLTNQGGIAYVFMQGWLAMTNWFRTAWSIQFGNILHITLTDIRLIIQGEAGGFGQAGHMLGDAVIAGMVAAIQAGAGQVAAAVAAVMPGTAGTGTGTGTQAPYVPPTGGGGSGSGGSGGGGGIGGGGSHATSVTGPATFGQIIIQAGAFVFNSNPQENADAVDAVLRRYGAVAA